jgi:DNA-directed RNA polymerase beta subunit
MPWGIDENGQPIVFDIVMSLSCMTNRLTVGQYYEAVTGVKAAKEGRRIIINPSEDCNEHSETILYDGKTGELIERESENGPIPVMASWGISRVWQMTQMTWDKQHYTHNTSGKSSITTALGRTAGGGIKFGEMDNHAIDASGLYQAGKEMKMRINTIDSQMCTHCEEFIDTCSCGEDRALTNVSIPWSQMVFNFADVLTTGYVTKYKLCF